MLIAPDYKIVQQPYIDSMKTDTLERRLRFAPPQPLNTRISLQEADFLLFEAINRHGPLPTNYLHAFVKHRSKNHNAFQYRLTKLFNGSANTPPLLSRPPQQFASYMARYQHLIYDLTKSSQALLTERDVIATARTDPFMHRFMAACVGASIELASAPWGLRYIPRAEILSRCQNPLAIRLSQKTIIPDDLFGLQYSDKSYRFFAVEIDRNTESIERKMLHQSGFGKKLDAYHDLLTTRAYKDHWKIPNLLVLTITTNSRHLENIVAHLSQRDKSTFKERFLFKAKHGFGMNWRVPEVMNDLLTEPWARANEPFDISKP